MFDKSMKKVFNVISGENTNSDDNQNPSNQAATNEEVAKQQHAVDSTPRSVTKVDRADLEKQIDAIIEQRKRDASVIERRLAEARETIGGIQSLRTQLAEISEASTGIRVSFDADDALRSLETSFRSCINELESLDREFSSDYLYDGISGEAGVGKSQTLQTLTGLSDAEIPTGTGGLPITAVRTEYVNSKHNIAEVRFRTPQSFMNDFVAPRLSCVAEALNLQLSCSDIRGFRTFNFNIELGAEDLLAHVCLRELQQAQRSLPKFEEKLTGKTCEISLSEIARYNSYPTADEIRSEERGGTVPSRYYLAVEAIVVQCPFPGMGKARVGLVDLPGLGEATEESSQAHIRDLNHRVNHITVIAAANGTRAHFTESMRRNLENLARIQPGITRRSDLISVSVNCFTGKEDATSTLMNEIEAMLNSSSSRQQRYEIKQYSALDRESVYHLFLNSYKATAEKLPELDRQKIAFALRDQMKSELARATLTMLQKDLDRMRQSIPTARELNRKRIEQLSGAIVKGYVDLSANHHKGAGSESAVFGTYKQEIQKIRESMALRIREGFLCGSKDAWLQRAAGQKNHFEFYLNECDRLMCEMVTAYGRLDVIYDSGLDQFKLNVADVLVDSADGLRAALDAQVGSRKADSLTLIQEGLIPAVGERCLADAFEFLAGLRFNFFSNVLHRIKSNLKMLDPAPIYPLGSKLGDPSIKQLLEDPACNANERTKRLKEVLEQLALGANNSIADALTKQKDYFNNYLSDALHFFDYYLYRYDQDAFDYGVVAAIVQEYGEALYGADADSGKDEKLLEMIRTARKSIAEVQSRLH